MLLYNISHDELLKIIVQLEQSLYHHQQWYNLLIRTLICKLSIDKHDIDPEAYKECRFGQWYYGEAPPSLRDHPGFIALGLEHHRMHQLAASLLNSMHLEKTILPYEYDHFANALERVRLEIHTLKRELETLLYNRDPLTGAINRLNMLPILREEQAMAQREVYSCVLAMVDIDLFKQINDTYGHHTGDKSLIFVAQYLINNLRPYDKIFRYGGEEFLLCLQNIELMESFNLLERVRTGLAESNPDLGLEKPLRITISCGIASLDPYSPIEQSIARADKAMYVAKTQGRNRTQVWNPELIPAANNSPT